MFTIIGADGREYGPVPVDKVRDWIAAHRADGQTKARREGTTEWKPLAEFPEFAAALGLTPPAEPPPPVSAPAGAPRAVDAQAYAADLIARAPKLRIGDTIAAAWVLLTRNFWPLVGVTLLISVVQAAANSIPILGLVASLLFSGVFSGGLYYYYLRRIRGQPAEIGDAFAGFTLAFAPLMLGGLVSALLTGVGLILLIIPGLYLAVAWSFTAPLIIDHKLEFWTAMEVSRRVVTAQWWRVFGLMILAVLIAMLGVLVCIVGVVFTMPIAVGALVFAYETLCNPAPKRG
jgi:hypothetical protein